MIRAKRVGTWFGLRRRERRMFELAMKLDVKLQSHDLLRALVAVLKNLRQTCDAAGVAFMKAMRLAWAISEAAERWGNTKAREWRNDLDYVKFLGMNFARGIPPTNF